MKRNIILSLVLSMLLILSIGCGKENASNETNKFEGTWVYYDKDNTVQVASIENVDKFSLVTLNSYSYVPLMDYYSSGLDLADRTKQAGETAIAHADYALRKVNDTYYNDRGYPHENKLDMAIRAIIYNEKDNALIIENKVFHKESEENSLKAYLPAMKENCKKGVIQERQESISGLRPKPTIQFDFQFDDSILDNNQ